MRWFVAVAVLCAAIASFLYAPTTHALSLELRPLQYTAQLKAGDKQKGYIDVTNTTSDSITLQTQVQAFKQIDNQGNLTFYDDSRVAAGLIPDLKEAQLGAGQTLRMYFLLDGTKLPQGDVFAALFFKTATAAGSGAGGSVRLGTLFSIQNGTPAAHTAALKRVSVPFFQTGSNVSGTYMIQNTADPSQNTGFYPEVKIVAAPANVNVSHVSNLVFAGRTRTNRFTVPITDFGLYIVTVKYGNSSASRLVLHATLLQLGILVALLAALVVGVVAIWRKWGAAFWHRRTGR